MAKGAGSTRNSALWNTGMNTPPTPSGVYSKDGKLGILSNADGGDIPDKIWSEKSQLSAIYQDWKYNAKAGYDMTDSSWIFITKGGNMITANYMEDIPKFKMSDVIFMENQNAESLEAWYDNSNSKYKDIIERLTAYKLK